MGAQSQRIAADQDRRDDGGRGQPPGVGALLPTRGRHRIDGTALHLAIDGRKHPCPQRLRGLPRRGGVGQLRRGGPEGGQLASTLRADVQMPLDHRPIRVRKGVERTQGDELPQVVVLHPSGPIHQRFTQLQQSAPDPCLDRPERLRQPGRNFAMREPGEVGQVDRRALRLTQH